MYFTNKGCGLCVADERLKANLKVIKEKKAEPQKIRGFEIKKLSKESLHEDRIQQQESEKRAVKITYGAVTLYSLLFTFFPRIMMEYKDALKDMGISIQLVVYILFFNFLHFMVKKYRSFLVRRVGVLTINALITYTYCCVFIAIVVSNDIDWARLFKAF